MHELRIVDRLELIQENTEVIASYFKQIQTASDFNNAEDTMV